MHQRSVTIFSLYLASKTVNNSQFCLYTKSTLKQTRTKCWQFWLRFGPADLHYSHVFRQAMFCAHLIVIWSSKLKSGNIMLKPFTVVFINNKLTILEHCFINLCLKNSYNK